MFWHVVLMLFSPLYLFFGLVFRSEQARLILALYQQVLILQRQLGKRPSLIPAERLALVLASLLLGKAKLAEALRIVKPETLVGWLYPRKTLSGRSEGVLYHKSSAAACSGSCP